MKPYVICHMFGSVDGKIVQTIWGMKNHHKYFEEPAAKIKADAWLVGRVTMEEFSSKNKRVPKSKEPVDRNDFVAIQPVRQYAVVIDPKGKCTWDKNRVSTEHVIEVLTESVSNDYLNHLRSRNVSFIFAGKKQVNLSIALDKLNKLFKIKRVRIDGGGTVNGSFLKAGLIDEFSLVLAPLADGTMGTPSVFDAQKGYGKRMATHFRLVSVKRIYEDFLWIRYKTIRGKVNR